MVKWLEQVNNDVLPRLTSHYVQEVKQVRV